MGKTVRMESCPECGSKDNVAIYADGGAHCFSPGCTHHVHTRGSQHVAPMKRSRLEMSGAIIALKDRKISRETCEKFGVTAAQNEKGEITRHWYPAFNTESGDLVASKTRHCAEKGFAWTGNREGIGLFGQNTCSGRGKYITITEGELDAMAVSEMFDNKWDVVSLVDGAQSADRDIARSLEFLEGYDNIILCFDMDKAGRKAVDDVKDMFSPNKVKVVELPVKDAGAMLEQRQLRAFTKCWWDAKSYHPAGIVKASETWDAVLQYRDTPYINYPWAGLNELLIGQRQKELNIWAAETGVGKSQTMREIIWDIIASTDQQVGCLMLEESVAKSMLGWMSFHAGRPLHKELNQIPDAELKQYWELASSGDRFVLLDHKGWGNNIDTLKARVRYMAKALNCRTIVIDHLHIALSSVAGASGDWSGIDELVTQLTQLAIECDVCLHLVSHVSEGRSLRGSKGIGKLADAIIFLERDKHHEDPEIANTTVVVVDKNRFCGDVGIACYLRYDKGTGRMTECEKPMEYTEVEEF